MDKESDDALRYVNVSAEMGESIADTSEEMMALALARCYKKLPRNTTMDEIQVWMICTAAATLARVLLKDKVASGTNLKLANQYIKNILKNTPQLEPEG